MRKLNHKFPEITFPHSLVYSHTRGGAALYCRDYYEQDARTNFCNKDGPLMG